MDKKKTVNDCFIEATVYAQVINKIAKQRAPIAKELSDGVTTVNNLIGWFKTEEEV